MTGERGMYVADYINQDLIFYANPEAPETWEDRGADGADQPGGQDADVCSPIPGNRQRGAVDRMRHAPEVLRARELADSVFSGRAAHWDATEEYPWENVKALADAAREGGLEF